MQGLKQRKATIFRKGSKLLGFIFHGPRGLICVTMAAVGDCTKNLSFAEFKVSEDFPELAADMEFSPLDRFKSFLIAATIIQPCRDHVGLPATVTSGKRSEDLLNALAAAGYPVSRTSDHLFQGVSIGVDFTFGSSIANLKAFLFMQEKCRYAFGQFIAYKTAAGDIKHLHVSLPTPRHFGEVLEKIDGKPIRVVFAGHDFKPGTTPDFSGL